MSLVLSKRNYQVYLDGPQSVMLEYCTHCIVMLDQNSINVIVSTKVAEKGKIMILDFRGIVRVEGTQFERK